MSYTVLNKLANGPWRCELLPSGFCRLIQDNIPEAGEVREFKNPEEIDNRKLAEIIELRKPGLKPYRTLSIDAPDYQPIEYLLRGIRSANTVCLLKQEFKLEELWKLIESRSIDAYPQILLDIAEALNLEREFWYKKDEYKNISDALKNSAFKRKFETNPSKLISVPLATGFLVGKNYLLTNHHVLSTTDDLKKVIARFRYEHDSNTPKLKPVDYQLDPSFFVTNEELDYTLVKLKPLDKDNKKKNQVAYLEAGNNFGWLPMSEDEVLVSPPLKLKSDQESNQERIEFVVDYLKNSPKEQKQLLPRQTRQTRQTRQKERWIDKISKLGLPGEPVNIIQHPRGRGKEIVLSGNKVQKIYENFLQYETDTDFGSSGSPILNVDWQLVGLHHAMLVSLDENSDEENFTIEGNLGIRVHSIVKDLEKQKEEKTEIKNFLKNYVDGGRPRRIFISAGRDRSNILGESDGEFERKKMECLSQKIKKELKENNFEVRLLSEGSAEQIINKINSHNNDENQESYLDGYLVGDLALELLTNSYKDKPEVRGASAYYVGLESYRYQRRIHAEILLESLIETVENKLETPELILPSRGVRSDEAVGKLPFCRRIIMPSLVLYVGYLTNENDQELITNYIDIFAQGIAKGIIRWSDSLRPLNKREKEKLKEMI